MSASFDACAVVRRAAAAAVEAAGLRAAELALCATNNEAPAVEGGDAVSSDGLAVAARVLIALCAVPELGEVPVEDALRLADEAGHVAARAVQLRAEPEALRDGVAGAAGATAPCIDAALRVAAVAAIARALWAVHEAALRELLPLDAHIAYWRERADWRFAYGPTVARAYDLLEGGPVEWAVAAASGVESLAVHLRVSPEHSFAAAIAALSRTAGALGATEDSCSTSVPATLSGASSAAPIVRLPPAAPSVAMPPASKARALEDLRAGLLAQLGATRTHLDSLGSAGSPGAVADACAEAATFLVHSLRLDNVASPGGAEAAAAVQLLHDELRHRGGVLDPASAVVWAPAIARVAAHATRAAADALPSAVAARLGPLRSRSLLRQRWLRWTLMTAAVCGGAVAVVTYRAEIRAWVTSTARSLAAFWDEHLAAPVREMAGASPRDACPGRLYLHS